MDKKETHFDRWICAVRNGRRPDPKDAAAVDKRASALHNSFPKRINQVNVTLKSTRRALQEKQSEREVATESIIQDVILARTEDGKPVYSNETTRKIEILKRTLADKKCVALSEKITTLQAKLDAHVILIERLRSDYSAFKDYLRLELGTQIEPRPQGSGH